MQTTALSIPITNTQSPPAGAAWLWGRAAALIAVLFTFIGSPARLIRSGGLTRSQSRGLNRMIAPIEALVRSLLMADAIAWLLGTEEGADMLRNARQDAANKARAASHSVASAMRTTAGEAPCTDDPDNVAPAESENVSATTDLTDAGIAAMLAPDRLRFRPWEIVRHGYDVTGAARAASTDRRRASARRLTAAILLARRIEALRLIIANPRPMMLALARELAAGSHGDLYVPSPRHWIDDRWTFGHGEIREARRASFTRYRFFQTLRARDAILALPPPAPG